MRRFHTPFPGHGHRWLFDRMRANDQTKSGTAEDAPDYSIIEPFQKGD
ncbi:MAG: hypothetical protein RQ750_03875 [Roseovarius sp.]|nr:hypothetical protein [Roseovarius sp.]